jgi:hypothetical protein
MKIHNEQKHLSIRGSPGGETDPEKTHNIPFFVTKRDKLKNNAPNDAM